MTKEEQEKSGEEQDIKKNKIWKEQMIQEKKKQKEKKERQRKTKNENEGGKEPKNTTKKHGKHVAEKKERKKEKEFNTSRIWKWKS